MMFKINVVYRDIFWEWCQKQNIICEYMGTNSYSKFDTWYIGNEKDKLFAILRWS